MVSNLDIKRLNTAISTAISDDVLSKGEALHSEIKAKISSDNKDVISRIGAELADRQIGNMVTSHLRQWTQIKENGDRQLSLPGIPATVLENMPALITVPQDDGETRHVLLSRATVGEIRRFDAFMNDHLEAVKKTKNASGFIVRQVQGCADDVKLVEALSQKGRAAA